VSVPADDLDSSVDEDCLVRVLLELPAREHVRATR